MKLGRPKSGSREKLTIHEPIHSKAMCNVQCAMHFSCMAHFIDTHVHNNAIRCSDEIIWSGQQVYKAKFASRLREVVQDPSAWERHV